MVLKMLIRSCVRQLFEQSFHEWKMIPLYLIQKVLEANFKFHSDLDV